MNTETLEALKGSIAKWERNAAAKDVKDVLLGLTDCPLCQIFHKYCGGPDCAGCPVNDAGYWRCGDTPYDGAEKAFGAWDGDTGEEHEANAAEAFRKVARAEADFLKSLLPADAPILPSAEMESGK